MFGFRKKETATCQGHYTGESTIDGIRFNMRGGVKNEIKPGVEFESYIFVRNAHGDGNMRSAIYEYEVDGIVYQRAVEHVFLPYGKIKKMAGMPCIVTYEVRNPGKSKAKKLKKNKEK